jgi:hypothetical protein
MPLQIHCRKHMGTDDTLVFDKSNDLMSNNCFDRQANMHMMSDRTFERIDHNQDSIVMCSNIDGIMTKEDEEPKNNEASQIQLKYVKMLEELDSDEFVYAH